MSPTSVLVFAAILVGLVQSHNWIASPSRIPFAGRVFPCMSRKSALPHVQVVGEQEFNLEWSVGHNNLFYFTLLKEEDSERMVLHELAYLAEYVDQAPAGTFDYVNPNSWDDPTEAHRYQRLRRMPPSGGGPGYNFGDRVIPPGDPLYMDRPPLIEVPPNRAPTFQGVGQLMKYRDGDQTRDRVISYHNPDKPHIIAMWRYEIIHGRANENDIARFWVPGGQPGNYVLHTRWNGFMDCVDINVLNETEHEPLSFEEIYGTRSGSLASESSFISNRIDHCAFKSIDRVFGSPREVFGNNGEEVCVQQCIEQFEVFSGITTTNADQGCNGVMVFPYTLMDRAFQINDWTASDNYLSQMFEDAITMPTGTGFNAQATIPVSTRTNIRAAWEARKSAILAGDEPEFQVCIPIASAAVTSTADIFYVTDDPEDPAWFSTCFEVVEKIDFVGYEQTGKFVARQPWSYSGQCISCEAQAYNSQPVVPLWSPDFPDDCVHCDRDPVGEPELFPVSVIREQGYCASSANTKEITVPAVGTAPTSYESNDFLNLEACSALVERDPECGPTFWYGAETFAIDFSPGGNTRNRDDVLRPQWACHCVRQSATSVGCPTQFNDATANSVEQNMKVYSQFARQIPVTTNTPAKSPLTPYGKIPPGSFSSCGASGGVQDSTGQFCCTGDCTTCGSDPLVQDGVMCYAPGISMDRPCSLWAPPCVIDM